MSLDRLQAIVRTGMTALDPAAFDGGPLAPALRLLLGDTPLAIEGVTVTERQDALTLVATAVGTPWAELGLGSGIGLTAVFTADGGDRALMRFTLDPHTSLSDLLQGSFARLGESLEAELVAKLDSRVAAMTYDTATTTLSLKTEPALRLSLEDLRRRLAGAPVASVLPAALPFAQSGLELNRFDVAGRLDLGIVSYFEAVVAPATETSWTLIDDLLIVDDLAGRFVIGNVIVAPFATLVVEATARFGGVPLAASLVLPQLDILCGLDLDPEDTGPDVTTLLGDLFDTPIPLPAVHARRLDLVGQPSVGRYEISAAIATDWMIVDRLALTGLSIDVLLITEPTWEVWGGLGANLTVGTAHFEIGADYEEGADGWRFEGRLAEGSTIKVAGLLGGIATSFGLADDPSEAIGDLLGDPEITGLSVALDTATNDARFVGSVELAAIGTATGDWPTIDLDIGLGNTTAGHHLDVSGALVIDDLRFDLGFEVDSVDGTRTATMFGRFRSTSEAGQRINLVNDLLQPVLGSAGLTLPDDQWNLTTLWVHELLLAKTPTGYLFAGDLSWRPRLDIGGEQIDLDVRGLVNLQRDLKLASTNGTIRAEIGSELGGLELLSVSLVYDFGASAEKHVAFELEIGDLTFVVEYQHAESGVQELTFRTHARNASLTIGEVVSFVVSLFDPSIDRFELEPPWNFITDFDLVNLLDKVELSLRAIPGGDRELSVSVIDLDVIVPEPLRPLIQIDSLRFGYHFVTDDATGRRTRKTSMGFVGAMPRRSDPTDHLSTFTWDPVNEAPPTVPGHAPAMFELRYLGLGQHVGFTGDPEFASMEEVIGALSGSVQKQIEDRRAALAAGDTDGDVSLGNLEFRADSEWLIGLDASLLRAIDLAVIFNDPEIYGLRIGLHGGAVKAFDGLELEILYQRITDTLGKYHVELVLPEELRHIQLGAVSITLGVIVVDVYTNGDFKLDFGFPWQGDFARSSALEVFPFVGAGGFYLNKLSALTAGDSSVPTPKNPKATFTPIYEFGLGLRIGVGKSFRSGPLSASISIIVEGIVEGVISWYNPPALPAGDGKPAVLPAPELYYRIRGGVAIVGRLHGRVDFKVIAVVVDVVARAGILFAIEPYRPIAIALAARVDVQASIEIAFITVDFSFGLQIRHEFTIAPPEGTDAPWLTA